MKKRIKIILSTMILTILIGQVMSPIAYARTSIFSKKNKGKEEAKIQPNVFKIAQEKAIDGIRKFDLREVIPENVQLRDQKTSNICWTFSLIKSLETNLALQDKRNGKTGVEPYDFSEIHMAAGTSARFAGGEKNPFGSEFKEINHGGTDTQGFAYLVSGLGAVNEKDMPFNKYYQPGQNGNSPLKTPTLAEMKQALPKTRVYDTKQFYGSIWNNLPDATPDKKANRERDIKIIKNHIYNHGAIYGIIDTSIRSQTINKQTNAIYSFSNNPEKAHAISIIGWDDDYSRKNFLEDPGADGAWIAMNSYGKQEHKDDSDPAEIYYISYNHSIATPPGGGIVKASTELGYDHLYQYDLLGVAYDYMTKSKEVLIGSKFDKKETGKEYLNEVMVYSPGGAVEQAEHTYEVYVNSKNDTMDINQCQKVQLEAGNSETCEAGYHTLEFANPVELTGQKFAVILKVTANQDIRVGVECKAGTEFQGITIEKGKCFIDESGKNSNWTDLGTKNIYNDVQGGDLTIKAYTTKTPKQAEQKIKEIKIVKAPNKTIYVEGENFDPTGMEVEAYYEDTTKEPLKLKSTDYNISNGNNLKLEQKSVQISYKGLSTEQPITVKKMTGIEITKQPVKTNYTEGENFDSTGMEVSAKYSDGTSEKITNYQIVNGQSLKKNQIEVIIKYQQYEAKVKITVKAKEITPEPERKITGIEITKEPAKTNYTEGENFDATGMEVSAEYSDGTSEKITNYQIVNGQSLKKNQTEVTIKYQQYEAKVKITVKKKETNPDNPDKPEQDIKATGMKISQKPEKTKYIKGKEELDLTGGEIEISYSDGTNEKIAMTNGEVKTEGFDNETVGIKTVKIIYNEFEDTFEVEVVNPPEMNVVKNSDLSKIQNKASRTRTYLFTENSEKAYTLIDMKITGIETNEYHDDLEYYYYISPKNNEENIQNWVKIEEKLGESGNLEFEIDSRKIEGLQNIINEDNVYIYIKEIAKKESNQTIEIAKPMILNPSEKIEIYKDGKKVEEVDVDNNKNDDSKLPDELPFAGGISFTLLITIFTILAVTLYKKNKKYNGIK